MLICSDSAKPCDLKFRYNYQTLREPRKPNHIAQKSECVRYGEFTVAIIPNCVHRCPAIVEPNFCCMLDIPAKSLNRSVKTAVHRFLSAGWLHCILDADVKIPQGQAPPQEKSIVPQMPIATIASRRPFKLTSRLHINTACARKAT